MHNISIKNMQLRRLFIRAVLMFTVIWLSGSLFTVSSYADGEKGKKGNKADTTAETKNNNDGGNLTNDKVVTGTKKLVQDATVAIQAIGTLVCILLAIYFFVRMAGADEQDKKIWKNRITISIVSAVGIVTVAGIIGTIVSYYV